jgi:pyrroline-5-carboxylate reductase
MLIGDMMEMIGFVGAGNMAEAIIQGILAAGLFTPEQVHVSDLRVDQLNKLSRKYGVTTVPDNGELATRTDIVVLSVKPMTLMDALDSIKQHLKPNVLIISIVAGKRIADMSDILGDRPIIRVMPNTPALINEGASALYANALAQPFVEKIKTMFECVGKAVVVDRENLIDAVTAVSGSGPAYYFLMMEKMIEAATGLGLSSDLAETLVLQTAKGAALLAEQASAQNETPADLTRKVATPGGTTEAALTSFNKGGLGELVNTALGQAYLRSQTLSG